MFRKKETNLLIIILLIAGFLRFFNLMHDSPYFFNPDERNMANAISQFRLPSDLSQIPICLISQLINDPGSLLPKLDPGSSITTCNLNPHFFAYGQFPLYLAYASNLISQIGQIGQISYFSANFPSAIFWLRFYSALSSTLTVLLVYLITKQFLHYQAKKWDVRNVKLDNEMGSGKKNLTSHFNNPASHFPLLTSILAAFTPGLIQSAHFGTTESLLTLFFLASVYLSIKLLEIPFDNSLKKYVIRNTQYVILLSLSIGLALGSKLTGIFFFVPPLSSLMVQIIKLSSQRISKKRKIIGVWGYCVIGLSIITGSVFISIVSSPYNLIEPENFKSAVFGYEQDVATGKYGAFYTKQFVKTVPIIFQAEKIMPYALGWPVFILGSIGILLLTIKSLITLILFILQKAQSSKLKAQKLKVIKYLDFGNLDLIWILIFGFWIYFLPNAFLFAKWTRFMTPILPFFAIFAVIALLKLKNLLGYWVIGLLVIISVLPGIAFMSIYQTKDTRIQASEWIYQNIPNNSYILSETANVVDIPLGLKDTSDGGPKGLPWKGLLRGGGNSEQLYNNNYQVISFDFYHLDENSALFNQLLAHLEKANYIFIPSRRIFANYTRFPQKFPLITKYYQLLSSGVLGFEKVAEISSYPKLTIEPPGRRPVYPERSRRGLLPGVRWEFPDENAEETFTVFDHPVIRIYRKVHGYTPDQYRSLLTTARID